MASMAHGRGGPQPNDVLEDGSVNNLHPPPSTLAAQLVENISASSRSSRPDETAELKKFFGIIEEVKNHPDLLSTERERVEHNHMLIYVYSRVVLEGLKWDDPFANRAQLQADALRAIEFLKVTIKETPEVLLISSTGGSYLLRGQEPLWLWVLPKVLRMLGHSQCHNLKDSIEGFFKALYQVLSETGYLWPLAPQLASYLRVIFTTIHDRVVSLNHSKSGRDAPLDLQVPPHTYFEYFDRVTFEAKEEQCTYRISFVSHALRHAASLLAIIAQPLGMESVQRNVSPLYMEHYLWLLDNFLLLNEAQSGFDTNAVGCLLTLLQLNLQLLQRIPTDSAVDVKIKQKVEFILVIQCVEVSRRLELLVAKGEGPLVNKLLCSALVKVGEICISDQTVSRLASSLLLPALEKLSASSNVMIMGTDLWGCLELLQHITKDPKLSKAIEPPAPEQFSDQDLRLRVTRLTLNISPSGDSESHTKKRKIANEHGTLTRILGKLYWILQAEYTGEIGKLGDVVKNVFPSLTEKQQCSVIDLLGHLCCASDDTLLIEPGPGSATFKLRCSFCGPVDTSCKPIKCVDHMAKAAAFGIFSFLVTTPTFIESRRPRILAMHVLRRLAQHASEIGFLDLEVSTAAQWCLKSLQSSVRQLRIAASRTLSMFVGSELIARFGTALVVRRNQNLAFNVMKQLSEQEAPHLNEACIMAWSQVGRVVSDDQLNLILVKLVDYLGHQSGIASAAAFNELYSLARHRRLTPRQLFEPYWRYLAFSAVKDMIARPKAARLLAELLELSVSELLLMIQVHALPWLVLTKRQDVIQKFAEARKETESWQPCLDNDNLGPILALLLIQDAPDVSVNAIGLLRHVSPHFDELSLLDLVQIEPLMTTLELLKAAADAEDHRKARIHTALNLMAGMIQRANGETGLKKSSATGRFLQQHALGLMTRLTDVINDTSNVRSPVQEQIRSIKAMEEMIEIGRTYVRIARPQISACTLAAMSNDDLRSSAFSCWATMMNLLEDEDVEMLIETTFFLIGHYWTELDLGSRDKARIVLQRLLDTSDPTLKALISKLPSFSHISDLAELDVRLNELRQPVDNRTAFFLLAERISHENSGVVLQALTELASYLERQQGYLQALAISEQPDSVVPTLIRSLLDCAWRFAADQREIGRLCTQSLGLLGCLDSNRVETVRAGKHMVVLRNFEESSETTDFVLFMLEEVLVKAFVSATDTKLQGFLSYAMQELLERCDISTAIKQAGTRGEADVIYRKFLAVSESAREVLTPFLNSKYVLAPMVQQQTDYPVLRPGKTYGNWIRTFTLDLLRRPQNAFAQLIFEPLCRVIRVKDLSTTEFLLPYVVVHAMIAEDNSPEIRSHVLRELVSALQQEVPENAPYVEKEDKKLFYEAVFRVLDYAMRWLHQKRAKQYQDSADITATERVQSILDALPAELISQRAVDCKAFSRALFHLEQHIRQAEQDQNGSGKRERLLQRLQDIYTQIDEPDGLEGISAHLHVLDINQQILSHRKAGRWAAAQTWYEIKQAQDPSNIDVQIDLLTCLKESGQHDVLLNYVEGIEEHTAETTINRIVPYAVEASWATGRWNTMEKFIVKYQGDRAENFDVSIAQALLHLKKGWNKEFVDEVRTMRDHVGSSMTFTATSSLHACHEQMLKCHVLTDLELIAGINSDSSHHPQEVLKTLNRRLEVLGSYVNDKQYILGIRRAAMELMRPRFGDSDISSLWLSSARLARKANSMHQSFNAVLHASELGDDSATIDNARLLWKQGYNRKAIQTLQGAIASDAFASPSFMNESDSMEKSSDSQQNLLTARAHLLLAKWLDSAGQTNAAALRQHYQNVPKNYGTWEKGHYYLGRHYKKVLESEKALKPDDQSDEYLTGEVARLVIENYVRSLNFGTKYLYQTLPRILTLWLELGAQIDKAPEGKVSLSRELHHRRKSQLQLLHAYLYKHIARMPAYIFYTALPQIVARIAHPNADVFAVLEKIIMKVVEAHPKQSLWGLFAIMTSRQATSERRARGQQILQKLRGLSKKVEGDSFDLKSLLRMGEKLAEQLLLACNNGDFQSNRTTVASITRDLNFSHKCTPCPLVVPIETCLFASLPTLTDNVKKHKAFSRDVITIDSFLDEVLVLGSLAKPRKLTARGSDGKNYGLLIKPKDDLRTDQRLMEFNSMINRSLKRDAESSRRQLYIKTYAVTPLNEECGIIEWVDGLKTLREILLNLYRSRGIVPNYIQLGQMMKDSLISDKNSNIFTEGILGQFQPVLPLWFISQFPDPSAWFAARLKYTRSCAVMSMVGTILGLGDRHGENILLEEGNGGVFHVDFNCLFDKGLTFAQPERVPFRLTHNMVAAMGIYGYEGPFRQSSELTLGILRQQEETLMTILEAFVYDPTLDLQRDKKRKNEAVKLNPNSVVESIKRKVQGLLPEESIPLGVEGQVEELIKKAVNPKNLAAMYIGWCPFL